MGSFGLSVGDVSSNTTSGLDVLALVEQAIYAEAAPQRQWQAYQTRLNSQAAALREINSKLLDLLSKVNALKDLSGPLNAKQVTSSNPAVVVATAGAATPALTHVITVSGLATTSSYYSDQLLSGSSTFTTGSFDLKVGTGNAVNIIVSSDRNTLDALAEHLNNDFEAAATGLLSLTDNAGEGETVTIGSRVYTFMSELSAADEVLIGATASDSLANLKAAINHEAGEGTSYGVGTTAHRDVSAPDLTATTLTLAALRAGSDGNSIATTDTLAGGFFAATTLTGGRDDLGVTGTVITDAGGARLALVSNASGAPGDLTISNNTTGLAFTKGAEGSNASLTVNGIPVSSAGNTVTGVIPGLVLSLLGISTGQVEIKVAPDTTQAQAAIEAFVASYNVAASSIQAQFAYNPNTKQAGVLSGESALLSVQQTLLAAVRYAISDNGGFVNLATIGVNLQDDGTLAVDSAKLNHALEHNCTNVLALFQGTSPAGFARHFSTDLEYLTDRSSGPLNRRADGVSQSQSTVDRQLEDFEYRLSIRRRQLTEQFSQIDAILRQLPLLLAQIRTQLGNLG